MPGLRFLRNRSSAAQVQSDKYLIVGLGNPGPEHTGNRHNVGFMCLNRLAKRHAISFKAGRNAWTGEGQIESQPVVLLKPRTFVNRSGTAVSAVVRRESIPPERVLVVYDELDLPEGRIRLRERG